MINDNPMYEKYVEISWCPADVKDMRPDWSDDKCMEVLSQISADLNDRSIELGWEVMEHLLDMQDDEEYDEEDEDEIN